MIVPGIVTLSLSVMLGGCALLGVGDQLARLEALSHVAGTVKTTYESSGPLVVVLIRVTEGGLEIADHHIRPLAGAWHFMVTPGRYRLAAFEDVNRDLKYQHGEPAAPPDPDRTIELAPGQEVIGLELEIALDTPVERVAEIDIAAWQARSVADQRNASLGALTVAGEVVSLSDERFDADVGRYGMWRPVDFMLEHGAGVFFLEPYQRTKIPVLFVHGITGSPREFEQLAGALDPTRFQPWFYHYPSGIALDTVSTHLANTVVALRSRYRFESIAVVGHSMGGLVAQAFIAKYAATTGDEVPAFVTLATPFGGHEAAQLAVDTGPIPVVPSWLDMAPGSSFIESLFGGSANALPESTHHHAFFGFRRDSGSSGHSGDKVVSVASQLRPEVQQRAVRIVGFDEDHTSILRDAEVAAELNAILEQQHSRGLLRTVRDVLVAPLRIDLPRLSSF